MALVGQYVRHDQALAATSRPASKSLPRRQPPAAHALVLGTGGLLADQFFGLCIYQPGRAGNHTQQLAHLFQDDDEHLIQIEGGTECLTGSVEQCQLAIALSQSLLGCQAFLQVAD